ncbi:MAG TPA: hypothetical protein VM598_06405 [Bdellovibrionota bacterium]|nr:hypothetical protein [Bdellovibrionota bacterium]
MRAGKFEVWGLCLAVSLLGAGNALGASIAENSYPGWATDEGFTSQEFQNCGLRCVYFQSVEKGSVKTRHLLQTMAAVQALPSTASPDSLEEVIGQGFCDQGDKESTKECQIRWFKLQIPQLLSDRVSIRINTSSATELQNGKQEATLDGARADTSKPREQATATLVNYRDPKDPAQKPIVTQVKRYDPLSQEAKAHNVRDAHLIVGKEHSLFLEIERMTSQQGLAGVTREGYYEKRKILKDPEDPSAGYYEIVATDGNQMPKFKQAEFNAAVKQRAQDLGLDDKEKKRMMHTLKQLQQIHSSQIASQKRREIYNQVRNEVLDAAAKGMKHYKVTPRRTTASAARKPVQSAATAAQTGKTGLLSSQRAGTGSPGVSDLGQRQGASGTSEDADIELPATTPDATSRGYYTVAYPDNVLASEIQNMENALGDLKKP